jgi:hypothetical protein
VPHVGVHLAKIAHRPVEAFQDHNLTAVHFRRRVATEVAGEAWTGEHRPVPGQPEPPSDFWIPTDTPART